MARHYCQKCTKPEVSCVCKWLQPQTTSTAVIILQHPDEALKAIGTAKLISLGLAKAKIVSRLSICEHEFRDLLSSMSCAQPLLIYPHVLNEEQSHYVYDFEKEHFTSMPLQKAYDSIILLDGTWRNTRELLHCNEWLKSFPTLNLVNVSHSRYRIRQANQEGALATIEAVSQVLGLFEDGFQAEKLLKPFEKMIDFQIERMGLETYQKNYHKNNNG